MKNSILKSIIWGALFGTFVYFTGPLIFVILLLKFIFTPFAMGRMRYSKMAFAGLGPGFADKIRSMSDDEFTVFKNNMESRFRDNCHKREENI